MHSPISQFRKFLAQFSGLSAISFAQPFTPHEVSSNLRTVLSSPTRFKRVSIKCKPEPGSGTTKDSKWTSPITFATAFTFREIGWKATSLPLVAPIDFEPHWGRRRRRRNGVVGSSDPTKSRVSTLARRHARARSRRLTRSLPLSPFPRGDNIHASTAFRPSRRRLSRSPASLSFPSLASSLTLTPSSPFLFFSRPPHYHQSNRVTVCSCARVTVCSSQFNHRQVVLRSALFETR